MARPKKTSPKRGQQESSTRPRRPAVVWIAPNLERITKGERGRRGLTDPSGGYYLSLADLVLKDGASKPDQAASSTLRADETPFARPFPADPESPRQQPGPEQRKSPKISSSKQLKAPPVSKRPKVERPRQSSPEHPKLTLPRFRPPKPPKFEAPQLPKSPRKPKPPRRRG